MAFPILGFNPIIGSVPHLDADFRVPRNMMIRKGIRRLYFDLEYNGNFENILI
jgi:hypothetical protein